MEYALPRIAGDYSIYIETGPDMLYEESSRPARGAGEGVGRTETGIAMVSLLGYSLLFSWSPRGVSGLSP